MLSISSIIKPVYLHHQTIQFFHLLHKGQADQWSWEDTSIDIRFLLWKESWSKGGASLWMYNFFSVSGCVMPSIVVPLALDRRPHWLRVALALTLFCSFHSYGSYTILTQVSLVVYGSHTLKFRHSTLMIFEKGKQAFWNCFRTVEFRGMNVTKCSHNIRPISNDMMLSCLAKPPLSPWTHSLAKRPRAQYEDSARRRRRMLLMSLFFSFHMS